MESIQLFENLGYILTRNDDDYIIYEKLLKGDIKKVVSFSYQLQNFNVSFENTPPSEQTPNINMELFKAIQKQLLELGWIN